MVEPATRWLEILTQFDACIGGLRQRGVLLHRVTDIRKESEDLLDRDYSVLEEVRQLAQEPPEADNPSGSLFPKPMDLHFLDETHDWRPATLRVETNSIEVHLVKPFKPETLAFAVRRVRCDTGNGDS
ncbi:hypothetical protein GTA62_21040 [Roseobacter sp. HKCCD9010]|uniref:hypothetical protein n=1 Tax=unclassified Roseobacter TaxID=196798 RepID=UPI001492A9C4|nr:MULTISPECIES: hypothetical protein [unclassified Roseobacter]MBF9052473.1 hypothetical protein [Rhodobacterales bacterium HKCCD4356]NNV87761.1 hypothetical protein [Roseobacter sp. HKCCD8414]NNZ71060.1 hypothetical protein [Roseobacter sp. HKCCD6544]NOA22166.1 hypothetical protein [Roseobacter sp. HKCCD6541]NOA26195.1 hypothetical protein [Roseobacter sp. HKCCD5935]